MPFKKFAKKGFKKGVKFVRKRYGNNPGISNLVSDVKLLKTMINVEKKSRTLFSATPETFALNNAAADGILAVSLQISPDQGPGASQRNGNSIKFVSAMFQANILQQTVTVNPLRYRWAIINRPDNSVDMTATAMALLVWDINPFSGFRDYFANKDPEYFTQFKVIAQGKGVLKSDSITDVRQSAFIKRPLKLNHHQKYDTNTSVITTKNKFYLVVQADSGDTDVFTGASIDWNIKYYYVDN